MEIIQNLALAGGLSWASGLRLYLTVFAVGLLSKFGYVYLPAALDILRNPIVLSVAGRLAATRSLTPRQNPSVMLPHLLAKKACWSQAAGWFSRTPPCLSACYAVLSS